MSKDLTANLMLHCGGHRLEYEQLQEIKAPDPVGIWNPIDHTVVFQTMMDALTDSGYKVMKAVHAVSRKGSNYFGLAQVNADYLETEEYGLVVGFRNSHCKSFAASMVAGAQVFVCDNLAFSGEVNFKHKHTTNVLEKLPMLFKQGVGNLNSLYVNQENRYKAYKVHALEDLKTEKIVVDMYRDNLITTQEVGKIIDIYDQPTHDEYGKGTAWTLFNATTEVVKGKLARLPKTTMGLHQTLDNECGAELSALGVAVA